MNKLVAALLVAVLLSLSAAVCSQTVQADDTLEASFQLDSEQSWFLLALTAVLVGVYIAVIVFLIAKKNRT